jgi:hypothetical protein
MIRSRHEPNQYIISTSSSIRLVILLLQLHTCISSALQLFPSAAMVVITTSIMMVHHHTIHGKVPDRSRLVQHRYNTGQIASLHDNGYPIDGHGYRKITRSQLYSNIDEEVQQRIQDDLQLLHENQNDELQKRHLLRSNTNNNNKNKNDNSNSNLAPWQRPIPQKNENGDLIVTKDFFDAVMADFNDNNSNDHEYDQQDERQLSSQLSGCCYNYKAYSASSLCALYGNDCESGNTKSHDDGDSSCSGDGLAFIGVSFSVNTASGNPYSYQLCDQFPMENIIDRDYEYVMSMDEDGWLVGGGYKTFDYSGKMPYVFF